MNLVYEHNMLMDCIDFYFIKGFWSRKDIQEESDLDKCFLYSKLLQVHKHYWDVEGLHRDPVSAWLIIQLMFRCNDANMLYWGLYYD